MGVCSVGDGDARDRDSDVVQAGVKRPDVKHAVSQTGEAVAIDDRRAGTSAVESMSARVEVTRRREAERAVSSDLARTEQGIPETHRSATPRVTAGPAASAWTPCHERLPHPMAVYSGSTRLPVDLTDIPLTARRPRNPARSTARGRERARRTRGARH
jgi:hypothetical protein